MRRPLGLTTVVTLLCITIGPVAQAAEVCPNGVQPRKEVRTLTSAEWTRFANALKKLQAGSAPTAYDKLAKVHIDWAMPVHAAPMFFPFHRTYLRELERQLQAVDPGLMLPYWNTSLDATAPERAPVWAADRFGGTNSSSGCVTNGYFAGLEAYYPARHCLSRTWDQGTRISPWHSIEAINSIVASSQTYLAFRVAVENGAHGKVHASFGGDMRGMSAANDPVFWLEEAYWDKVWADWQRSKPANMKAYGGSNVDGSPAVVTDVVRPYTPRVQDVFDTRSLCYQYQ